MLLKIHRSYRNVVALVDSALLGRKFEEGKRQLEIKEHFFKGDEMSREQVVAILRRQLAEDATFTIVGKEAVECAIEAEVLAQDGFAEIEGVVFGLRLF